MRSRNPSLIFCGAKEGSTVPCWQTYCLCFLYITVFPLSIHFLLFRQPNIGYVWQSNSTRNRPTWETSMQNGVLALTTGLANILQHCFCTSKDQNCRLPMWVWKKKNHLCHHCTAFCNRKRDKKIKKIDLQETHFNCKINSLSAVP